MGWLRRLLGRDRLEHELDAELSFHVAEETRRLEREGVSAADALRQALAAFGGVEATKEHARDARGTRWVEDLGKDLRYAVRMMRRSPAFTLTAVLSLAIGIGANTAIFSVMDALVVRSLPIERPGQTYFLNRTGFDEMNLRFSYPMLEQLRAEIPDVSFSAMTPIARFQVTVGDAAEFALGQLVSGEWFDVAGVGPGIGRVLHASDDVEIDGHPVVVLSDAFWARRFGRSPVVVGQELLINGAPFTVVGVAKPGFSGLYVGQASDLWVPAKMQHALHHQGNASMDDAVPSRPWVTQAGIQWLRIFLRVPEGTSLPRVTEQIDRIYRRPLEEQAASIADEARRAFVLREHIEVLSARRGLSDLRDRFTEPLGVLMTTVALVLLIACANLASLLLARSSAREREFSLRLSIGALRGRLVRQLLTESLLLSCLGGALGLAVASWGSQALLRLASSTSNVIPLDVGLDWRLVGFTLVVSLVTGLLFGLAPALRLSRSNIGGSLRGAGRVVGASASRSRLPLGRLLVVTQVSLSLVLLVGALLFLVTLRNLVGTPTGFDRTEVVTARFDPRVSGITEAELPGLYRRLLKEMRRIPGIRTATLALSGPVTGSMSISGITIEGRTPQLRGDDAREEYVGPDYFATVGIQILRGRDLAASDVENRPKVALVNEAFVRHFFGDQDPIGKRFGYDPPFEYEIVGIVRDALVDGVRSAVPKQIYYPLAQHPGMFARNAYIRADGAMPTLKPMLARAVANADSHLAVREVVTLDELTGRTVSTERMLSSLTAVFAGLAVAVACLGLFGTVAYSVARRQNELGVRIALGASPGGVRWMVLREVVLLVAAGCVAGVVLAMVAGRYVGSLLFGLTADDPRVLAAAAAVLLAMGFVSAFVPAWRASRVNPLIALRAE